MKKNLPWFGERSVIARARKVFATAVGMACIHTAGAASDDTHTLPPVVVQVNRLDGKRIDSSAASQSQNLYDAQALSAGHERTVDEILRGEPGVSIVKASAYGQGLLYLRGAGGQGLLTWDGLPVPDSLPGALNLNNVLPDGLGAIEVGRGFNSAAQAFSSSGGQIRLISREAQDTRADLRLEAGTFGFLKETLRGDLAGENARLALTFNHADAFDGAHQAQESNGNPERDPFRATQISTKAQADIGDAVAWEGSMLYRNSWNAMDSIGARGGIPILADDPKGFFAEENWLAQNALKFRLSPDWLSRLQLGYVHARNDGRLNDVRVEHTAEIYLARWENAQKLWRGSGEDALSLVWGAEGRHETISAPVYLIPSLAPGGIFAQARSQQAGFLETRVSLGAFGGEVGVRYESYDRYDSHALLHLGASWRMAPNLTLRANGGNGFLIPGYVDLAFPLLGNRTLRPERGAGGDLGLEWRPAQGAKLNLAGFYTRYDDLMVISWNIRPSAQVPCLGQCLTNVADAVVAGMEASGEYRVGPS